MSLLVSLLTLSVYPKSRVESYEYMSGRCLLDTYRLTHEKPMNLR